MKNATLITGASSGIGLELAKIFAEHDHDLVLVARRRDKLEDLARELTAQHGVTAHVIAKDLAAPGAAQEIFDETAQAGITVDILVNNAGFQVYGNFFEVDLDKLLAMIQVNLTTLTHLTGLFLPGMVQRGHGRVLNIGSTGSFVPGPLNAVYCATKAYVISFSEAIAEELDGTGVTATALCPGATHTEFASHANIEDINVFKNTMSARAVAEAGYRAMMRGTRVMVPGFNNKLMAFATRFVPRRMVARASKQAMSKH
jgi:short-subunit dehydrogenase